MSHPTVGLHVDHDDIVRASIQVMAYEPHSKTGLLMSASIGDGFAIYSADGVTPGEFAGLFDRLAADVRSSARRVIASQWAEAHPEEPTPLDRGGPCEGCQRTTDQLYAVDVRGTSGEGELAVCAVCGHVEPSLAGQLSKAIKLDQGDVAQHGHDRYQEQRDIAAEQVA